MTNQGTGRSSGDRGLGESSFFGFAKPYFDYIGKGKIYSIAYIVMAFLNLLIPMVTIYVVIQFGFLQYSGAKVIVAFIFSWLVIAFASWIGFQLWWYRKSGVRRAESSDFIATPVVSDLIQTFGEWLGTFTGIVGAGVGLIATIFLWSSTDQLSGMFGLRFLDFAPLVILIGPIVGFFIILCFRFIAEQIRIWAAIANNTRELARNSRK